MTDPPGDRPAWADALHRGAGLVEAVAGVCLTTFLVVGCVGAGGLCVLLTSWTGQRTRVPVSQRPAWTAAWLVLTAFGVRSAAFLVRSLERGHPPFPVSIADRRLGTWWPLRPLTAAWWVGLSGGSLVAAHYVVAYLRSTVENPDEVRYRLVVPAAVLFAAAVAANTNLLVAIAAATGRPGAVRVVFRLRLVLDLGVTYLMFRLRLPQVDPFKVPRH